MFIEIHRRLGHSITIRPPKLNEAALEEIENRYDRKLNVSIYFSEKAVT